MKFFSTAARVLALSSVFALSASATTWQIDPNHSSIAFSVRHMMISNVKGSFHAFKGTIDYDGKDASTASVEATIQTSSIDTGIGKRDDHLRSGDFFDVAQHPTITFKSTKITPSGDKSAKIAGDLTIRGITKPVTIDAELNGTVSDPKLGNHAGFSGSTSISRKDFGLVWNKAIETGGVMVGDEIKINLEIEAGEKKADADKATKQETKSK